MLVVKNYLQRIGKSYIRAKENGNVIENKKMQQNSDVEE